MSVERIVHVLLLSCVQGEWAVSRIRSNGTPASSAARRTASAAPSNWQRTTSSSRIRIEPEKADRLAGRGELGGAAEAPVRRAARTSASVTPGQKHSAMKLRAASPTRAEGRVRPRPRESGGNPTESRARTRS